MRLMMLILAVTFWWQETAYFGWNFRPESPEELICDGIVSLMLTVLLATWVPRTELPR